MLGLFAPRCPLTLGLKVWTERRFRDIGEVLGASHLRTVEVIEPGGDLFESTDDPDLLIGRIFEQVCRWMDVPSSSLRLKLISGLEMADLYGAQNHGRIEAAKSLYAIPAQEDEPATLLISAQIDLELERLLAIIARGVAHDVLRTRIPDLFAAEDRMQSIDLVPVFFGLGPSVANSTVREVNGEYGMTSTFQISRTGHLSAELFGYALALFSWVRGEPLPDWSRRLRLDAKETMKAGLKFLAKTNDCVFDADSFGYRTQLDSVASLRSALGETSATQQMNALLNLVTQPEEAQQLADEIIPILRSRDRDLRAQAVHTLAWSAAENEESLGAILSLDVDPDSPVRFAVAAALRPGSTDDESSIRTLAELLTDRDPGVSRQAAARLLEFESLPEDLLRPAIDLLKSGNVRCDELMIRYALEMLGRLCENVDAVLEAELDDDSRAMIADLADDVLGEPDPSEP
ncbi:MAG: HEAT repeat domain-containing protein [Planctomycetes bacterium]|nr:HEAT repeat domain-containing protein [Planctomycetota bacterium]